MGSFSGDLQIRFLKEFEGEKAVVTKSFTYHIDSPLMKSKTVERGFITDGNSIPKFLRGAYSVWGQEGQAGVLHDCLYKNPFINIGVVSKRIKRKACDKIFLEALGVLGVSWLKRRTMYLGVRIGGWYAWKEHRNAEK